MKRLSHPSSVYQERGRLCNREYPRGQARGTLQPDQRRGGWRIYFLWKPANRTRGSRNRYCIKLHRNATGRAATRTATLSNTLKGLNTYWHYFCCSKSKFIGRSNSVDEVVYYFEMQREMLHSRIFPVAFKKQLTKVELAEVSSCLSNIAPRRE
jgi:hypothetical protein